MEMVGGERTNEIEKEAVLVILELLYQSLPVEETKDCYVFDTRCISAYENAYKFLKRFGLTTKDSNNRIFKVPKAKAKEFGFD